MSLAEIVTVLFTAYITVDMARYLRSGELRTDFWVFRTLKRWRWIGAVVGSVALVAVTFAIGVTLYSNLAPVARWSWLLLLQNPTHPEPQAGNLMTAGIKIPWFALVFFPLLALNIPRLAKREEEVFRHGIRSVPQALFKSIKFGFVHAVVGVPLGFCTALIIPGLAFSWIYTKGGTRLSAAWHAVYNYIVLTLAFVLLYALPLVSAVTSPRN